MTTAAQILSDIERTMRELYAANQGVSAYPLPIIVSPNLPVIVDKKPLLSKSWHTRRFYPKRITKKWRKRYGFDVVHCFETTEAFFVSRDYYKRLPKDRRFSW